MAQQGAAGSSVHLSFDHLGLVVDSLGAAVVVRHCEFGGDGLDVQVEAAGERVQVGQAVVTPASVSACPGWRLPGRVSIIRRPGGATEGPVCVQAALVDVAHQQVGASLVAAFADLPQQLGDRDALLFGPPLAEVVAVRVDEGGPVLRDALYPFGLRWRGHSA